MLYRIKQFILAVFSRFTYEDKVFIEQYLNDKDKSLFEKLPTHEKKHCINVAKYVINHNKNVDKFIVKASLLHDIGKINSFLNPFFKGFIVILDKISEKFTRKLAFIKPVKVYYNHPQIGYDLYKNIDLNIANIIREHHNYNSTDYIINIIQEADNKN